MVSTVKTLLWAWILTTSAMSLVTLPDITDEAFIDECVRGHNRARSSVTPAASDMLYMKWDKDLAMTAREWASRCMFKYKPDLKLTGRTHPNFSFVGENLWTGYTPTLFNAASAIQNWVEEKQDYDYDSNICTNVCGHYKQVVWATTNKVGCAAYLCPNGVQTTNFADRESVIFVCNYAPAGGINGGQPYRSEGKFCSGCEGVCVEKLCRNPERNSLQSSDGDIDWNSFQNPKDLNYGRILIIRPLGLIGTLVAAYGLHYLYPNIFCYE